MEQESQFGMTPEKIEELRRVQREEQQRAEAGGNMSLQEAAKLVEKGLVRERPLFEPSLETIQLIEKERITSFRQLEFLKILAYFYEQIVEKCKAVLSFRHHGVYLAEEDRELRDVLGNLTLRYEDLLERQNEYPAAREMLKDIYEYLDTVNKIPVAQPIGIVWDEAVKRIAVFHSALLEKEAKSEYEEQRISIFVHKMVSSILGRIPQIVQGPAKEKILEQMKISKAAEKIKKSELYGEELGKGAVVSPDDERETEERKVQTFAAFETLLSEDFPERHHKVEHLEVPIPVEAGKRWREEFFRLLEEKSAVHKEDSLTEHKLVLGGESIRQIFGGSAVEIIYQKEDAGSIGNVVISVSNPSAETLITVVAITPASRVITTLEWYDNEPGSLRKAEAVKKISSEQWNQFLELVLEQARKS